MRFLPLIRFLFCSDSNRTTFVAEWSTCLVISKHDAFYMPTEILRGVFSHLPAKSLARASCVAKSWNCVTGELNVREKVKLEKAWRCGEFERRGMSFGAVNGTEWHTFTRSTQKGNLLLLKSPALIVALDIESVCFRGFYASGLNTPICLMDEGVLCAPDDGTVLVTNVQAFQTESLTVITSFQVDFNIYEFADVGEYVAICGQYGFLGLWEKNEYTCAEVLDEGDLDNHKYNPEKDLLCMAFCKETRMLVCGSRGGTLMVWNLGKYTLVKVIKGHSKSVLAVEMNETFILSSSSDQTVRIWNRSSGECMQVLENRKDNSWRVALCGDMFARQSGNNIQIWNIDENLCIRQFDGGLNIIGMHLMAQALTVVLLDGEIVTWDLVLPK
ncbi:hypothetical protein BSKO_02802 [Bryopsis sp. KO-2023]|nr:hypothetical protein BSKO_02802 [Bryopsis sp. KO-2023]